MLNYVKLFFYSISLVLFMTACAAPGSKVEEPEVGEEVGEETDDETATEEATEETAAEEATEEATEEAAAPGTESTGKAGTAGERAPTDSAKKAEGTQPEEKSTQ